MKRWVGEDAAYAFKKRLWGWLLPPSVCPLTGSRSRSRNRRHSRHPPGASKEAR